jgi:hypothetical protein
MKVAWWAWALLGLVLIAGLLAPFASSLPDGLEGFMERHGLHAYQRTQPAPLPDYGTPGLAGPRLGTFIAAAAGTAVVFAVTLLFGRLLARRRSAAGPEPHDPPL